MIPIIDSVISLVSVWIQGKQKTAQAKQEMKTAELANKARLLADTESNNHAWEMANLTDKDKWLRRMSFAMFSAPFIIAIFAPEHVASYFSSAIHAVPEWWEKTFMAITGSVWGISSLKNILPAVMDGLRKTGVRK